MPRSKLHSFRALILASLAHGTSLIKKPKVNADWNEAIKTMRLYGATINKIEDDTYEIIGVGGKLKTPADIVNVNNSGTMLAFIAGVAASCPEWSLVTGDESIRTLRKITKNFIEPFSELGVTVISTKNDGMAPFIFRGPITKEKTRIDGTGCQPVFSLLIAAVLAENPVEIIVDNPGETAYIDLLLYSCYHKEQGP